MSDLGQGRVRSGILIDVDQSGGIVEVVPRTSGERAASRNDEILVNEFPKAARKVGGGFRFGCTFVTDAAITELIRLYQEG